MDLRCLTHTYVYKHAPIWIHIVLSTYTQLKEREAALRAQVARLEAEGVETRADLDRLLTEQAEVLIQVRL